MSPEPNPYAPPHGGDAEAARVAAAPAGAPLHLFTLQQPGRATWTLSIYPDVLRLVPSDAQPVRQLEHGDFGDLARLNLFGKRSSLALRKPAPAVVLPLSPEALTALRAWMDPALAAHLAKVLASQRGTPIVLGLLWGVSSMATERHAAEPAGVVFGALWLAWALAATLRPHRVLFVLYAALWVGVGVSFAARIALGASRWQVVFILLVWPAISMALRSYRFYGPTEGAAG